MRLRLNRTIQANKWTIKKTKMNEGKRIRRRETLESRILLNKIVKVALA